MAFINGEEILFSATIHGGTSGGGGDVVIEARKNGNVVTLTITDSVGTQTVTINDGTDGKNGYNMFLTDGTVKDNVLGKAWIMSGDTREPQLGDLILDYSGNIWRIVGTNLDGVAVELQFNIKGTKGDKGDTGADGYTPQKGKDFYTDADKAEWSEYIASELAKRGQLKPEFAQTIEDCTDTSKMYVLPDGMIWAYMLTEKEVESGGYTNILETYKPSINTRWSYSSKNLTSATGYMTIGPVPVKPEDVVRINELWTQGNTFFAQGYCRIHYMDASGNYVSGTNDRAIYRDEKLINDENSASWVVGYVNATDNDWSTNTKIAGYNDITQMIVVVCPKQNIEITEADVAGYIMTINEKITEGSTSTDIVEGWASTGHAFVPADYEDRIIVIEDRTLRHTAEISALQKAVTSGGTDDSEAAALQRIKEWDKPIYDNAEVTLLGEERNKPALTTDDKTISAIYAKYRALMAEHPKYIKETNMGQSAYSATFPAVDMLYFEFKEPNGLTEPNMSPEGCHETKPKIILLSGVHKEWAGVYGLYYALEEITTNPAFDDIRRNAHIVVIPCANPYGLTTQAAVEGWTMSHVNANGVAIHNNFGAGWVQRGNLGEYNYSGTEPYSEPETQHIDAVMAEHSDAIAFVTCHNNDYSTFYGSHVIWGSSATYHMCNMVFRLADKMTKAWLAKYGQTLKDAIDQYKINMDADDYRLGRATMSTSAGTEQLNATKYGMQATNLEIPRMMYVFSGKTDCSSEVMTRGAEVYANFFRMLLASYDHKDKKEYAPNLPWEV